jgi:hypothetical protein
MTKKHFEAFARQIADEKDRAAAQRMADMVISVAVADNPRFDPTRFLNACGLGV